MTSTRVHCYNCYILLLVFANILLCLIRKLNTIHRHVCIRKEHTIDSIWYYSWSQASIESLETYSSKIRGGLLYYQLWFRVLPP